MEVLNTPSSVVPTRQVGRGQFCLCYAICYVILSYFAVLHYLIHEGHLAASMMSCALLTVLKYLCDMLLGP
jgi:hypothetical protein